MTGRHRQVLNALQCAAATVFVLNPFTFLPTALYLVWLVYRAYIGDRRDVANARAHEIQAGLEANKGQDADSNLLWYFAFGSNMDPDVLEKRRLVYPRQSKACSVEGYVLTFSHIGLPYMEPGFGTIEPLEWHPLPPTLVTPSPTNHSTAAQAGKATMFSTPSQQTAHQLAEATTKSHHVHAYANQDPQSPRAAPPSNAFTGSPELPISFGTARSAHKRSRTSPVSDASIDYESNEFDLDGSHPKGTHASPQTLARASEHQHVTVHGVAHQITRAEMAQVYKTEGGGGSKHSGYFGQLLPCKLYDGQVVHALGLLSRPNSMHRQAVPALPSQRYLQILQKGAKHNGLAEEYQIYLQALQHYEPSTRGQQIGGWITANTFGRPLKFFVIRILPHVKNDFLCWLIHQLFAILVRGAWSSHDYILEPVLGSGRHN